MAGAVSGKGGTKVDQGALGTQPTRPSWVTAAGVILLITATLSGFFGLIFLLFGVLMGSAMSDLIGADPSMPAIDPDAVGRFMVVLMAGMGAIVLAWAVANLLAGIGVLRRRGWARIVGIVLGVVGSVFSFLTAGALVWSTLVSLEYLNDPRYSDLYGVGPEMVLPGLALNFLLIVPFVAGYVIVTVVLIRSGTYFAATPPAPRT
jgi:hypothetical protein